MQLLSEVGRKVEEAKRVEEAVKALLVDGVDVNAKNKDSGRTALHDAAGKDSPEAVKVLIAAGADVNARVRFPNGSYGVAPLDRTGKIYVEGCKPRLSLGGDSS